MAKSWDSGDLVRLRSGGPVMTVEGEDDEGELECVWFFGHTSKRDVFPAEALEKAEGPEWHHGDDDDDDDDDD